MLQIGTPVDHHDSVCNYDWISKHPFLHVRKGCFLLCCFCLRTIFRLGPSKYRKMLKKYEKSSVFYLQKIGECCNMYL